jgi:hypothetical protein
MARFSVLDFARFNYEEFGGSCFDLNQRRLASLEQLHRQDFGPGWMDSTVRSDRNIIDNKKNVPPQIGIVFTAVLAPPAQGGARE